MLHIGATLTLNVMPTHCMYVAAMEAYYTRLWLIIQPYDTLYPSLPPLSSTQPYSSNLSPCLLPPITPLSLFLSVFRDITSRASSPHKMVFLRRTNTLTKLTLSSISPLSFPLTFSTGGNQVPVLSLPSELCPLLSQLSYHINQLEIRSPLRGPHNYNSPGEYLKPSMLQPPQSTSKLLEFSSAWLCLHTGLICPDPLC